MQGLSTALPMGYGERGSGRGGRQSGDRDGSRGGRGGRGGRGERGDDIDLSRLFLRMSMYICHSVTTRTKSIKLNNRRERQ